MLNLTSPAARLSGLALKFLLTLALHGALLYWVLHTMPGLAVVTHAAPAPIRVALIAPPRPAAAPVTAPRPLPATKPATKPAARPKPQRTPKPAPATLLTAASGTTAMASASAAPATPVAAEPVEVEVAVAAPAPPALEPARFNADYLNNPAPAYPLLSRRQGETGKVLLQVQVTERGTAGQVEIKQGSGFPRLDQAALNAVRQWRFVPARRGDTAVAASVVVPITFRLGG